MNNLEILAEVLAASVKRKGEVPLTNAHLLNIVKMAIRVEEGRQNAIDDLLSDVFGKDKGWG